MRVTRLFLGFDFSIILIWQDNCNPYQDQGRQQAKKKGGVDKKMGTFSNLKGHLTLSKPNPPLKTPRISAT